MYIILNILDMLTIELLYYVKLLVKKSIEFVYFFSTLLIVIQHF